MIIELRFLYKKGIELHKIEFMDAWKVLASCYYDISTNITPETP